MSKYIQCPHCKYVLPSADGGALFGELHLTAEQFVTYHSKPRSRCRNVEPVYLTRAQVEEFFKR